MAFSSGCVTCAFLKRKPYGRRTNMKKVNRKYFNCLGNYAIKDTELSTDLTIGLMKRSYLGGLRVKPSPTKQTLVTILFHAFFCLFPVLMTLSTSVSPWARTLGRGTSHLPYRKHCTFVFINYDISFSNVFIHNRHGLVLDSDKIPLNKKQINHFHASKSIILKCLGKNSLPPPLNTIIY